MGIYINMEMPMSGRILIVFPSGRVSEVSADATQDIFRETQAIHVSPHGDLIDRDTLEIRKHEKEAYDEVIALRKQKRFDATYEYYRGYSDGLITASGLVRFAPTIIPAEEGE